MVSGRPGLRKAGGEGTRPGLGKAVQAVQADNGAYRKINGTWLGAFHGILRSLAKIT